MVYRVYVEKKEALANEARALLEDLRAFLGIQSLTGLRLFNRYDLEGISRELFDYAVQTVLSEPQLDTVTSEVPQGDTVFAVEYLPGQYDQRADSAAQCIQILSQGERPLVRSARVYQLNGKLTAEEVGAIKKYLINPVEAREASLEPFATLAMTYDIPETVATLTGFRALDEAGLEKMVADYGLAMDVDDLRFCEEGGVTGMIRGETVAMGSAYFMRKQKVALPHDLKLQTGVFLAIDGVLGAIFVIKYQPSRNVDWALRAMRRAGLRPVLAVRSGNVTPGLLKRKFGIDCKPLYPNVSARLALSDVMEQQGDAPNAVIYREGLMPLAEAAIGSRRLRSVVRTGTWLCYAGAVVGLLLTYYLTSVGSYGTLSPLYMLAFLALWLLPTLLLSGLAKRF